MKITIDTQQDTHEDIRKVIKMLQHLVGSESYSNYESKPRNIFDDPSPNLGSYSEESSKPVESSGGGEVQSAAPTNAFSAMFGDGSSMASSEESSPNVEESNLDEKRPKRINFDNEIIPY